MVGGVYYAQRGVYPGWERCTMRRGVYTTGRERCTMRRGVYHRVYLRVYLGIYHRVYLKGVPRDTPRVYYTHHGIPYHTLVYTTLPYPGYTTLPYTTGYTASP